MISSSINLWRKKYRKNGTIMIPFKDNLNPFSLEEFISLKNYCEKVEKEYVAIGDAGEKNHLLVGRFMTDIKKPLIVKNAYSLKLLKILNTKKFKQFVQKILNTKKKLFIRRAQFNQIEKGNFVGYHLDVDSNPEYLTACVIQFGANFSGGLYRVYQKNKNYIDYKPSAGSLIMSNCYYPHEVTKVLSGERESLVFFISYNDGPNKRKN